MQSCLLGVESIGCVLGQGAEYEVMPCLAELKDAEMIDQIFLEEHTWFPDRTDQQTLLRHLMCLSRQA